MKIRCTEYEAEIKMVHKQWLKLKIKFYWVYMKLLFSEGMSLC